MTHLAEAVRQRVRQRAGNRCEYCLSHQEYVLGQLQVDHAVPVAKGSTDTEDNLCLTCELCNQCKWTRTHGLDPASEEQVALFNPQQDTLAEHFAWSTDGTRLWDNAVWPRHYTRFAAE